MFNFNWLTSLFSKPTPKVEINPLAGKRLFYLIGAKKIPYPLPLSHILEVGYDNNMEINQIDRDIAIAYCNLFDEKNTGNYGPYLHDSDTAAQYHEGQIDPKGPGWEKNLREQFERRKNSGFRYIELDNPDAYDWASVRGAIDLAGSYGLRVIAKNPGICENPYAYVNHPNVYGIIVERDAGSPMQMNNLRLTTNKFDLPVWFVYFGRDGLSYAEDTAYEINVRDYKNMFVTYSDNGEYGWPTRIVH